MNEPMPLSQPQVTPNFYSSLPLQKKEPYVYSRSEQVLAAAAALIGVWVQFLLYGSLASGDSAFVLLHLPYFAAFALLNRRALRENRVLLLATALSFLLTCTTLADPYSDYKFYNFLLVPCLFVALGCYSRGNYRPKQALDYIVQTLLGLFVNWFWAMHRLPMSVASLHRKGSGRWKLVLGGLALGGGMLVVLLPLMATADRVFSYFLSDFFYRLRLGEFMFRTVLAAVVALGSYSLLWCSRFRKYEPLVKQRPKLLFSATMVGVSFGVVLAVYALFCGVQFTYLFAGAALPRGMSYSEYAVSGFWELVQMAGINLALFAFLIEYGPKTRAFLALKLGLLAATGVMLASAILRLNLYIQAYQGMTWLRLVSMWFLIYMAALLALCAMRLFVENFPVVTVAALGLLGWWVALGFAMPWVYACWPQFG